MFKIHEMALAGAVRSAVLGRTITAVEMQNGLNMNVTFDDGLRVNVTLNQVFPQEPPPPPLPFPKRKIITVDVVLKAETDKAYGFDVGNRYQNAYGDDVLAWVAKSQCEYDATDKTLQLPEWLATKKGLI